ncbi:unnamed protein product, partial [Oppiella nova]
RTNFIIDSFYLSRAGLLSYETPLALSEYLKREKHLTPWSVAISMFAPIRRYLSSTEHKLNLDKFLSGLAEPIYTELGWDETTEETDVTKRLRSNVVDFYCSNNNDECIKGIQQKYYAWRADPKGAKIRPNIMTTVLKYSIRLIGGTNDWNYLWDVYMAETSTVLKLTYLNALSFASDKDLINKLIELSLDETKVRKQDFLSVFNNIIANPDGLQVMWDYYRDNYETLLNKHLSSGQMGTVVNNICNYFNDESRRKEVKDFFDKYPEVGVTQNERKRALETIDSNIIWINANKKFIGDWLTAKTVGYYLLY